jgi:hypothetical protein
MAAITLKTNLPEVAARLTKKLSRLKDKEYLLRPVCFDLVDLMRERIHQNGIASDGTQIGTYSSDYLKYRQKPPFNQKSENKVIVSLTRQMGNDWSVIATKNGYGIGFKNSFNLQKGRWVEAMKKPFLSLTAGELQYAQLRFDQLVSEALK